MTRYFKQFWPSNLLYLGLTTITSIQTILSALLSAAQLNALIKFDFPLFLRWVLWDVDNFIILLAMYYWQAMLRAKTTQKWIMPSGTISRTGSAARPGCKYAIVGPRGKSLMFNLLAGKLTAYAGSLTLNGQKHPY